MSDPDRRATPTVFAFPPKTLELEQRLARAEGTIAEQQADIESLTSMVDMLRKRLISLQAQLDHLFAKSGV